MLEPPSAPLLTLLRELRLCTLADLRRCRGRVRRMATDLPAFDSVWIDALVQLRRLTPFQAQILESPQPRRLRVGPCVLVERLVSSLSGATYLARSIATRQSRILKLVKLEEDLVAEVINRSRNLLETGKKLAHPSIVIPQACEQFDENLVFVSRHVPGRTLTELLIRRGRFPAQVVWQIGRQLADGLARLHALGLAHGDIRPSQVRLLSEGTAVLIDTGIQGVLEPELTPHSQLVPESYDCVAPELIGTGMTYNPASDLYALGCLMWQLLAGRPPFPGGDPLAKLAAHQTRRIRDVRDFAPDTPDKLAELILRMTSPNVSDRPANASAILQAWGAPRRAGRRVLKRFVSSFERPVVDGGRLAATLSSPVAWIVMLLFTISGLTAANIHAGTRATLLQMWASIPRPAATSLKDPATTGTHVDGAAVGAGGSHDLAEQFQPLPAPNAQGVIQLDTAGPYLARSITQIGVLTIRGREDVTAEIVLSEEPLFLLAEKVQLQHLRFRGHKRPDLDLPRLDAQVLVEALELDVRDCTFLTDADPGLPTMASSESGPRQKSPVAICWKVPDAAAAQSGTAVLENLVVWGTSPLLDLRSPARQITATNVLRLGSGSMLQVTVPPTNPLDLALQLEHVTCRQSGSLVRWTVLDHAPAKHQIQVRAKDCVFDILASEGGLLEFVGEKHVAEWSKRIKFVGDACLASEQTEIAVQRPPRNSQLIPLDDSELALEGITPGAYSFVGDFSLQPKASVIHNDYAYVGVRTSEDSPGIIAARLRSAGASTTLAPPANGRLSAATRAISADPRADN